MAKGRKQFDRAVELGEGPKAYDLFLTYVSLGVGRTISQVAEKTGRKMSTCSMLAHKFQWVRRSRAYDTHLHKVEQKAIENKVKSESVVWIEREYAHRHEAYKLSEKLFAKAAEMLQAPLYVTEVVEMQPVTVNGQTIEVPTKVIKKPVRWNYRTMKDIQEFADKLRRMAFGAPTSRVAVEVSPALTLEERITQARSAFKFWQETKLEAAVQRIISEDPSQDPDEVRAGILSVAPNWFCSDFGLDNPLLLTEGEDQLPPPLSLIEEDGYAN